MADATLECLKSGQLIGKDGAAYELHPNEYSHIGLYFSANWCPPCRSFTPVLATFYEDIRAKHDNKFEIVFVSSDQDEAQFDEYFATMPWVALKFCEMKSKETLKDTFSIAGIPTLVIIDPQGNCVTKDGRRFVTSNNLETTWL